MQIGTQCKTRIKMCGFTRMEDVRAAVATGADAIGLVFYPKSPRAVTIQQARELLQCIPPFVSAVGLFVDAERETVNQVLQQVPLSLLQFHGSEDPGYCESFGRAYIKVIRLPVDHSSDLSVGISATVAKHHNATGILLDTYSDKTAGGTGEVFDWSLIPADIGKPVILAGGLTPENVAAAVAQVKPYAVDVSSGIETAPGVKDAELMSAFVSQLNRSGHRT